EWKKLPEAQRKPSAVSIGEAGKADSRYARTPPAGGLILNVYTRILDRKDGAEFCRGTCKTPGGDRAAHDHLWLREKDWKALVPANPKKGDEFPCPAGVAERIVLFHLIDNTRGEPPFWGKDQIRSPARKPSPLLKVTVAEVTASKVRLRLDGSVLLATKPD